jgi:hypothetical protein
MAALIRGPKPEIKLPEFKENPALTDAPPGLLDENGSQD